MTFLWRWLKRAVLLALVCLIGLASPIAYIETACRGTAQPDPYISIVAKADRRPESRTFLTYPEWHMVHAYADYAAVITTDDPHDFNFLGSIGGFWGSLCDLSKTSATHGGFPWETKQMVYTIGVSFTAEFLLKAAYEETIGRVATQVRGDTRTALDDLSANQAAAYATFLQQTPWYKWDFTADAAALDAAATTALRDRERKLALGIEFRTKAAYAKLIEAAVASVGADPLTMRVIVKDITLEALAQTPGVKVIATRPEGIEIETPRYQAFTELAITLAGQGANFVEIAGNDDILFTAITQTPDNLMALHRFAHPEETGYRHLTLLKVASPEQVLHRFKLQGNPGYRQLILVKVAELAQALRASTADVQIEHIHDY
jgi:hypothetical protein